MPASHPLFTPAPAFELRTQKAALVFAAFFMAIGLLGFVPGVTVSVLQNLVHVAFAFAGVVGARSFGRARRYLIGGGVVYLAIVVVGGLLNTSGSTDFTISRHWPNLGIAVAMIIVGAATSRGRFDDGWHFGAGEGTRPQSVR